ncbi:MAG: hypothetical protein WAR37_00380 [Candidatus Microsaccharimonas sp.]
MDQAAEILVIIVSSILVIFLIVVITLGIYLIKLTAEIRRIAKSAQSAVSHIDNAFVGVSKLTSPLYVAQIVKRYIKKFSGKTKKGKK